MSDANLLRNFRTTLGITQTEAATMLGISDATIKSVETGRRSLAPQVKSYITATETGELTSGDTALSILSKASRALKNGDSDAAVRLAYTAIVIITR